MFALDSPKIKKVVEAISQLHLFQKKPQKWHREDCRIANKIHANLIIDIHADVEAILDPKNIEKLIQFHKNTHFDIVVPHMKSKIKKMLLK